MSTYNIDIFNPDGSLDKLIKELDKFGDKLEKGSKELLKELGDEALKVADEGYYGATGAVSGGTVNVTSEQSDDTYTITADGIAMFIEFGTGVYYPDSHPEGSVRPAGRGEWGKGRAKNPEGWWYEGEADAYTIKTSKRSSRAHKTLGMPAMECMENAKQHVIEIYEEKAREVFGL